MGFIEGRDGFAGDDEDATAVRPTERIETAPTAPAPGEAGRARLGDRYVTGRVLGRGAMATVYLARDTLLGRDVAIKVFRACADTAEQLGVQEAEARLLASLHHHAIATLLDAGIDLLEPERPRIYLVMEYVVGCDLKQRLQSGALEWQQVCWLGADLSDALASVHAAGVLHRDLKPANVLLAAAGESVRPRCKLTDFGISSAAGTGDGSEFVTGTAAYLSPEQVEGLGATAASDVYALGLVLLEALTARMAYPGDSIAAAIARLDRDPYIPSDVPAELAGVLRAMTARDPAARPAVAGLAERFQALITEDLLRRRQPSGVDVAAAGDSARAAALEAYGILDTPPEGSFDLATGLAQRLLHAPIALVSLVDADRVWFKSRQGFDLPQVPRDIAFCSTTDTGGAAWAVPDAEADSRTRDNPLVLQAPYVRSYAAAPLVTDGGVTLGALCVFDHRPRTFTDLELADLTMIAAVVMRELELRLASRRAVLRR